MEQVIFAGQGVAGPSTSETQYTSLVAGGGWTATESYTKKVISTGGKIKDLRIKLYMATPGAGKSYTFTLMVNGNPSALTVTISGTDSSGADTTHEVDVVAGDTVSLRCEPTNSPNMLLLFFTTMFEGSTAKESLILGGTGDNTLDKTATEYANLVAAVSIPSATENDHREVCPTSGKIKNLYVELSVDPGTSPDAYKFTLRKGGASQDLTVTITADDTTGHDTDHEVTVAAGDVLTLMIEPVETPSATPYAHWGMTFIADTDGESVILAGTDEDLNTGLTEYSCLQGRDVWQDIEDSFYQLGQSCTLKKLYVLLSAAPGDGKSYTFTLRKPGNGQADGNLTVTITGAATTTGNDVAHTDVISDDDYVDLKCVPSGTPTVADAYWGVVGYIEPAAPPPPGLENKSGNIAAKMMAAGVL